MKLYILSLCRELRLNNLQKYFLIHSTSLKCTQFERCFVHPLISFPSLLLNNNIVYVILYRPGAHNRTFHNIFTLSDLRFPVQPGPKCTKITLESDGLKAISFEHLLQLKYLKSFELSRKKMFLRN